MKRIDISANNDKRTQSIYSLGMYDYGVSKDILCKNKRSNIIQNETSQKRLYKYYTRMMLQKQS